MIENIQELYSQIDEKTKFIILASNHLGKSPLTLRNHWFSAFWSIPEEYQEQIVKLLQNTIKKQNTKATV